MAKGFQSRFLTIVASLLALSWGGPSANAGIFGEPFMGYEAANVTYKLNAGRLSSSYSASGHGLAGGIRLGTKKEKGFWGIGLEFAFASLGFASRGGNFKPYDLGIFATHFWRGGFRIRATWIPFSQAGGVTGRAIRGGIGFLLREHISLNFDFIYRKLDTLDLKDTSIDSKSTGGMVSFGIPFGEENTWRRRSSSY